MTPKSVQVSPPAELWPLVRRQHWVISRAQLLALGFGEEAIKHRVGAGRLHPIHAGVYAVGRPQLTRPGQFMAAVLACGEGAVLSHESAAELWGIRPRSPRLEVTVPAQRHPRPAGLRVHRRRYLRHGHHPLPSSSGHQARTHPGRPGCTPVDRANGACRQRSRQARPDRPRGAAHGARRHVREAWRTRTAKAPRQAHLHPYEVRARTTLQADREGGRPAPPANLRLRQWLRGRLLLARAGTRRGDRRPALPPHRGAAGPRPGA